MRAKPARILNFVIVTIVVVISIKNIKFLWRIVDQKLQVNSAIPGLPVQSSTDGGLTWSDVKHEMAVAGRVLLGTR